MGRLKEFPHFANNQMVESDNRNTLLIDKSSLTELQDIGLIRYDMLLSSLYKANLGEAKKYYDNDNDYIEIKNSEDFEEAKNFGTGQFIYIFIDVPKQPMPPSHGEQYYVNPGSYSIIGPTPTYYPPSNIVQQNYR